jgi:hypothetical protein
VLVFSSLTIVFIFHFPVWVEKEDTFLDSPPPLRSPLRPRRSASICLGQLVPPKAGSISLLCPATKGRKKSGNIKEKTVVPVVQAGKVEILPKRLIRSNLTVRRVFQIQPVQFRSFGNQASLSANHTPISHVSHRQLQMPCAKPIAYVKSASITAWDKVYANPGPPQG